MTCPRLILILYKLVRVNNSIVFLDDKHIGSFGIVVSLINQEEKYAAFRHHPEITKHLPDDNDVMYDIMTHSGEKIRLFYNEFTIVE